MAERVRELLESGERFATACGWIRKHLPPQPASRRYFSSYALKHIAEEEIGYITNGLFIAAMLHCGHGFIRQGPDNPNGYFPLSARRVVVLDRRRADGR